MKKYLVIAVSAIALASCSDDAYLGDNIQNTKSGGEIAFNFSNSNFQKTAEDKVGAEAADLLGKKFIVTGVKGAGSADGGTDMGNVFKSYTVDWAANTAGSASNTNDWDYVGKSNYFDKTAGFAQTIKYWDFSATAYDFAAYSVGRGNTITAKTTSNITDGGLPSSDVVYATPIDYANATTAAYKLRGSAAELAKCYITDMTTVAYASYGTKVNLSFRSLATKVRVALYETIPGYSVKNVKFYSADKTPTISPTATSEDATLFGTDAFYTSGTYTVYFPKIGSTNNADSDYEKAHVSIAGAGTTGTKTFGKLNYTGKDNLEAAGDIYLGRTSDHPTFAGTDTYYQTMLPNENGVVLELCADYTLVSIDGSGEEITVYGAKAYVPAVYTKWLPN